LDNFAKNSDEKSLITLLTGQTKIILSDGIFKEDMYMFKDRLQKALLGVLGLDKSIKDIGYAYNQYSHTICMENSPVKDNFLHQDSYWIGVKYQIWASELCVTWIYNDGQANITFEVTPFYPFMHLGAEMKQNYIPYEKWIKDYKPCVIKKLSKKVAEKWLNQINELID
jgi:hypothetical protein